MATGNTTLDLIISRLPNKPFVTPREIADACGFVTTASILDQVRSGLLDSVRLGKRFIISRESAIKYLQHQTH